MKEFDYQFLFLFMQKNERMQGNDRIKNESFLCNDVNFPMFFVICFSLLIHVFLSVCSFLRNIIIFKWSDYFLYVDVCCIF